MKKRIKGNECYVFELLDSPQNALNVMVLMFPVVLDFTKKNASRGFDFNQ